ncbi:hypothetical protein [Lysinibacillus xylanilyticus]|uniref:hypothetical protein n=1 Tax=Lysinibacillus xylanilyticus TaxID=582475 RepID=UPI00106432D7|nr:hypothetical protein [Lysinibacillus xylanilyticus]
MNLVDVITPGIGLITIYFSWKSSNKSNKTNLKLGELQDSTAGKHRIVENIGAQRIVWINNVRELFVEFNSLCAELQINNELVLLNGVDENKEGKLISYSQQLLKVMNNIELYLNPNEPYSQFLFDRMKEMREKVHDVNTVYHMFNLHREMVVFAQNVILKAEWRRVKKETDKGEFIDKKDMLKIFNEVGKEMNPGAHESILEKYFKKT